MYEAGALPAQHVVYALDERVERETAWAPHSHATHELLWNESDVSTVRVGSRVWTVTPTLGVWIPAGLVHAATAAAGTWYRTNHFDITRVPRLAPFLPGWTCESHRRHPGAASPAWACAGHSLHRCGSR